MMSDLIGVNDLDILATTETWLSAEVPMTPSLLVASHPRALNCDMFRDRTALAVV